MKLQTKLTLLIVGLLLLVTGALAAAVFSFSRRGSRATAAASLEDAVQSYAQEVYSARGRLRDFKLRTYDNGVYLQVYSADGSELLAGKDTFETASFMPQLLKEQEPGEVFYFRTDEAGVYGYLLWAAPEELRGRDEKKRLLDSSEDEAENGVWIVGLMPGDSMDSLMRSVVKLACFGLPVLLVFAALAGWLMTGRSLRVLRKITESAHEISDGSDLSRRIETVPGNDEVHELAETFNGMMARLERSFEAERQFTSDASHELRTPTAAILAECEMAERLLADSGKAGQNSADMEAVRESLAVIHEQAEKMSGLIGKLLSYTRLEQGTRKIDRERLDLSELTEEICEAQRVAISEKITIESRITPELFVCGDGALLIILIQNLLSNAVKYGREGGRVEVSVYPDGKNACVAVADDGIGISEENLARIWNRFYQVDASRSGGSYGAGLGLSLALQIARLHGGNITAESSLGNGSRFVFAMPRIFI